MTELEFYKTAKEVFMGEPNKYEGVLPRYTFLIKGKVKFAYGMCRVLVFYRGDTTVGLYRKIKDDIINAVIDSGGYHFFKSNEARLAFINRRIKELEDDNG